MGTRPISCRTAFGLLKQIKQNHVPTCCETRGYVPQGMIPAPCRCLDCDPQPIQARLFSHALVENDLGACVNCGQPACKLLVGGAGLPDLSLCERCEYRLYLAATGGRNFAIEQRVRWGLEPIPRPDLDPPAPEW